MIIYRVFRFLVEEVQLFAIWFWRFFLNGWAIDLIFWQKLRYYKKFSEKTRKKEDEDDRCFAWEPRLMKNWSLCVDPKWIIPKIGIQLKNAFLDRPLFPCPFWFLYSLFWLIGFRVWLGLAPCVFCSAVLLSATMFANKETKWNYHCLPIQFSGYFNFKWFVFS